eukprot:COSAG01_NODE_25868_length_730_cov_5.190174_1_plen_100_part_10
MAHVQRIKYESCQPQNNRRQCQSVSQCVSQCVSQSLTSQHMTSGRTGWPLFFLGRPCAPQWPGRLSWGGGGVGAGAGAGAGLGAGLGAGRGAATGLGDGD